MWDHPYISEKRLYLVLTPKTTENRHKTSIWSLFADFSFILLRYPISVTDTPLTKIIPEPGVALMSLIGHLGEKCPRICGENMPRDSKVVAIEVV